MRGKYPGPDAGLAAVLAFRYLTVHSVQAGAEVRHGVGKSSRGSEVSHHLRKLLTRNKLIFEACPKSPKKEEEGTA